MKTAKERIDLFNVGKNLLSFFNLLDRGNKLSITNVAVIVLLTKMAIAPFDWAVAAGLFVTLLNYAHKRQESNQMDKDSKANDNKHLATLQEQMDKFKVDHEEAAKALAETKKLLSNSNLAAGFMPKR